MAQEGEPGGSPSDYRQAVAECEAHFNEFSPYAWSVGRSFKIRCPVDSWLPPGLASTIRLRLYRGECKGKNEFGRVARPVCIT
jgi:hypothetical protein